MKRALMRAALFLWIAPRAAALSTALANWGKSAWASCFCPAVTCFRIWRMIWRMASLRFRLRSRARSLLRNAFFAARTLGIGDHLNTLQTVLCENPT